MSNVKMINVMSVLVAVFFLSTGIVFAQEWTTDGNDIYNTNSGKVKIKSYNSVMGTLEIGTYSTITSLSWNGTMTQIINGGLTDARTMVTLLDNSINFGNQDNLYLMTIDNADVKIDSLDLIINGGKVGIGTTDPGDYELAVEGEIGARKIVVTEAPWADFVFNEDYDLPSLEKVESYIKKNNHLPDIPSEKEIKETGLSVADLMAKQMQKIEELTLYVIELKKENERQSDRLASLEQVK